MFDTLGLPFIEEKWNIVRETTNIVHGITRSFVTAPKDGIRTVVIRNNDENVAYEAAAKVSILAHMRDTGTEPLRKFVSSITKETGLTPPKHVRVSTQKSLWGSMSASGTMSLSCRLLLLPAEMVRFVVIHELCHIIHMNHSPEFYALLKEHDPLSEELDKTLKHLKFPL